jgi:hypothetical protein
VNAADEALALAATLHAEDFPAGWAAYSPGEAFRIAPDSCSYRDGGAVTQVSNGGAQAGPTMQLGETGAFAASVAQVFPDESLAIEHIGVVNTEAWGVCRAGQLQQVQADAGSDNLVTVVTRDNPDLNQGGFESYAQFALSSPDGTLNRVILFSFYRIGRTVILQTLEYGGLSDAEFAQRTFGGVQPRERAVSPSRSHHGAPMRPRCHRHGFAGPHVPDSDETDTHTADSVRARQGWLGATSALPVPKSNPLTQDSVPV